MGLFESLVPDMIPLTEEQFKTFLEKAAVQMQIHSRYRLERANQSRGMEGGMGATLQPVFGAERTRGARRPPQL